MLQELILKTVLPTPPAKKREDVKSQDLSIFKFPKVNAILQSKISTGCVPGEQMAGRTILNPLPTVLPEIKDVSRVPQANDRNLMSLSPKLASLSCSSMLFVPAKSPEMF